MNTIIVGCGRVGSTLALQLTQAGHDVCVVDRRQDSLRRLGEDFPGRTVIGVGFDREVLAEAGITQDSLVAAVTSGDNSNILIARVARELFGAAHVVARIYDPQRASIYERLGIKTVASVAWTVGQIGSYLFPDGQQATWTDPTATVALREWMVPAALAATAAGVFEQRHSLRIASLTRNGSASIPSPSVLLQEGDLLHLVVLKSTDLATELAASVTVH
jgi:trk system potassium uptake protein